MFLMFFGSSKKAISPTEFNDALSALYYKGFSGRDRDEIKKIFRADLDEHGSNQPGIDEGELDRAISWMRKNKSSHGMSDEKIDLLEEVLKKRL